jgi:hypothetical protein
MAVTFMDPVNPYVLSDRATKYAVLFIVLTFGAVALSEFLGRRRVHPIQYTLVGLALSMFFLLLLSRKRAGNTPRELEVDQREAPGCQRCGSNSSIRPAGCVGSRVSTSLM